MDPKDKKILKLKKEIEDLERDLDLYRQEVYRFAGAQMTRVLPDSELLPLLQNHIRSGEDYMLKYSKIAELVLPYGEGKMDVIDRVKNLISHHESAKDFVQN